MNSLVIEEPVEIQEIKVPKKRGRKPKPKKTDDLVKKEPKKRGRKPKKKMEEDVNKEPKKRGRKPKKKDESVPPKIPKKRGRKKKTNIYSVKKPQVSTLFDGNNDTLILHLPISSKDIEGDMTEKKLLKYNELSVPKPFESENNFEIINIDMVNSNELKNNFSGFEGRIDNDKLNKKYDNNLIK